MGAWCTDIGLQQSEEHVEDLPAAQFRPVADSRKPKAVEQSDSAVQDRRQRPALLRQVLVPKLHKQYIHFKWRVEGSHRMVQDDNMGLHAYFRRKVRKLLNEFSLHKGGHAKKPQEQLQESAASMNDS